jgi:uncharacterized protein (DUF2461 family)
MKERTNGGTEDQSNGGTKDRRENSNRAHIKKYTQKFIFRMYRDVQYSRDVNGYVQY